MLHTEQFNHKPGQRYGVISVQDSHHGLRVTIAMASVHDTQGFRTITVLKSRANELGGIRPGDDLVFGEHAVLERVERCKEATACTSGSGSGSGSTSTSTSAGYELDERARHRHDLERMSMSALADAVAKNPNHAKETGEAMRAAIDALLGTTKEQA